MNKILLSSVFALISILFSPPNYATSISLTPSSTTVTVGNQFELELGISGLGDFSPVSLSIFDIDIGFDSSLMNFTGATFGDPVLGDQLDLFGFGSYTSVDNLAPGLVNLLELSFDDPNDLDILQAGSFTLATLTFDALADGISNFGVPFVLLGDSFGGPLPVDAVNLTNITITPANVAVPEPSVFWLFLIGLLFLTFNKLIPLNFNKVV